MITNGSLTSLDMVISANIAIAGVNLAEANLCSLIRRRPTNSR